MLNILLRSGLQETTTTFQQHLISVQDRMGISGGDVTDQDNTTHGVDEAEVYLGHTKYRTDLHTKI